MRHHCTLIVLASMVLVANSQAQITPCPGEPLIFQLEAEYHGTKTWEHSGDGINWTTVEVVENESFILQPEQSGWYRVRFYDADCDISYVSEAQRFATHAIDLGESITIRIGGVVKNEWGMPVGNAIVRAGCGDGVITTTDQFGVFLLDSVQAYEKLAYVVVEKDGYFKGSRSFVPDANAYGAVSYTHITLLHRTIAGTFESSMGGAVALEGVSITFAANGFVQNGQQYNGPVNVHINYIDPTSPQLHTQMPGMLMGVMNSEPQLMLSYGMAGVELTDGTGQHVQLASGSPATMHFPVMAAQLADAPSTIPLWWFDEGLGYWIHEGEAVLVGSAYIGQVSHFSWWNCDVPSDFVQLTGDVEDIATGLAHPNARIVIQTQSMGQGVTYTNTFGRFTGLVPLGEELLVQYYLPCASDGGWVLVDEGSISPLYAPLSFLNSVSTPWISNVIGDFLDCEGEPVQNGYVLMNDLVVFCTSGSYTYPTCAQFGSHFGVDLLTGNISPVMDYMVASDLVILDDMVACIAMFGSVSDIEGNVYTTVLIGEQEWMLDNLRTGSYANGTSIPQVEGQLEWIGLTDGAWGWYEGSDLNGTLYGKLYNWHAVSSTHGLCPQGWRIPEDTDWMVLESHIGIPSSLLLNEGYRGTFDNEGGKLKAVSMLWNGPNIGANNTTYFTGLPSGYRLGASGGYSSIGYYSGWWTSTGYNFTNAWLRGLHTGAGGVDRVHTNKRNGYCVRCIRE